MLTEAVTHSRNRVRLKLSIKFARLLEKTGQVFAQCLIQQIKLTKSILGLIFYSSLKSPKVFCTPLPFLTACLLYYTKQRYNINERGPWGQGSHTGGGGAVGWTHSPLASFWQPSGKSSDWPLLSVTEYFCRNKITVQFIKIYSVHQHRRIT